LVIVFRFLFGHLPQQSLPNIHSINPKGLKEAIANNPNNMEVKPAEAEAELKGKGAQEAVVSETKEVSNEKAEVPAAEDAPDPDEDDLDDLDGESSTKHMSYFS
jgi:hypothetical protein